MQGEGVVCGAVGGGGVCSAGGFTHEVGGRAGEFAKGGWDREGDEGGAAVCECVFG